MYPCNLYIVVYKNSIKFEISSLCYFFVLFFWFIILFCLLLFFVFFLFVGVLCNFFIIHKNKHKICFISSSKLLFLLKWHMQWKHSSTNNNKNTIMKKPLSAVVWKSNARLEVEGGNASGNPFICTLWKRTNPCISKYFRT